MAVRILSDGENQVMYCSTTEWAFGPVHSNLNYDLVDFLKWLGVDPRSFSDIQLQDYYIEWLNECKLKDQLNGNN